MNKRMIEIWNKVSKDFGKVGPKYWEYFGERLVEESHMGEGCKVLDIGCGAGASLFPAAEKVGKTGRVVGIDIASGMVNECLARGKARQINNFDAVTMDAVKLEFNEGSFDYVLNGFGFPYLYHMDHDFTEIKRVLNDKGRLCMVTWDEQEDNPWMMELVNKYLPKKKKNDNTNDANKEKTEKQYSLTSTKDIKTILDEAGFKNITVLTEDKYFTYKDKNEWWSEMYANAVRSILEKIEQQGTGHLDNFKKEAFVGLDDYKTDAGYTFKRSVFYVIAEL